MVQQGGIFADAFDAEVSIRLFSMVVIGGLSTIPGAVLGAAYVRGAEFFLPAQWTLIASGAGILLLLLVLPEGLGGALYRCATSCSGGSPPAATSTCRASSPTVGCVPDDPAPAPDESPDDELVDA